MTGIRFFTTFWTFASDMEDFWTLEEVLTLQRYFEHIFFLWSVSHWKVYEFSIDRNIFLHFKFKILVSTHYDMCHDQRLKTANFLDTIDTQPQEVQESTLKIEWKNILKNQALHIR